MIMKKLSALVFGMALLSLLPMKAWSQEAYVWYPGDGGHTLTFCYDDQRDSREGYTYDLNTGKNSPGWLQWNGYIITVEFDSTFVDARPTTTYKWFYNFWALNKIPTLANLNTSAVTDMSQMFYGCSMLFHPDMSNFDTSNVTDMSEMFYAKCCNP